MKWYERLIAAILSLFTPKLPPEKPKTEYPVTTGKHEQRTLTVPCSLSFRIRGKTTGDPQQEQVVAWAVEAGKDWGGGNPVPRCFSVRVNDYDARQIKVKCYGGDGVAREPKLSVAWPSAPSHLVTLAIRPGVVQFSVDGATVAIQMPTPPMVTLFYGDPESRRMAAGAVLSEIAWEGRP